MKRTAAAIGLVVVLLTASAQGQMLGWRGNLTGRYPDADPVIEWGRKAKGIAWGLKISAAKPVGDGPGRARPVKDHFPREWLVIGPLPAPQGLDDTALPDEAKAAPAEGEKVGELAWRPYAVPEDILPPYDRGSVAGAVSYRGIAPDKALGGFTPGSVVYAHTYLHSPADGEVEMIVGHSVGMKVLVNGREAYRDKDVRGGLGAYVQLGRMRAAFDIAVSPRFRVKLRKGWNRVLFKLAHYPRNHRSHAFHLRVVDAPGAPHEDTNILWAAPVHDRSIATPILVKDRLVVMAEPDQIICLDKTTGRQLWTRFLGRYQATPEAERNANPAFKATVAPLVAKLPRAKTLKERMDLRKAIDAALVAIDAEKYKLKWDGHMRGHFRVVGWTQPTPVSEGRHVYAYCGNGVAASFDADGHTRWIRRIKSGKLQYPCSPALIDGKLVIFLDRAAGAVALDADTGKELWRQPKLDRSIASLIPARIAGVDVVVSQQADIVRAADGHMLYENPLKHPSGNCIGWSPPLVAGDVVCKPWGGVNLILLDFAAATGDAWSCRAGKLTGLVVSRNSKGKWVDRQTAGSPLIHEGIYYNIDVFGTLYAADMKTKKLLYRVDLSGTFNALSHHNAVPVAASVTLGGKHLFVMDNQGTTVVFKPGPKFRKVAVNRIENAVHRPWPIRPQEEIGYSPPVFDGRRMYLRGEHYVYCIGRK